jgi:two-component system, OmpR family, sensor kinase
MTIRSRLTLWYVAVLATSLVLFGVMVYGALVRVVSMDIDDSLEVRAEDIARSIRARGELSFAPRRPVTARSDTVSMPVFYVELISLEGEVVDRSDALSEGMVPVSPSTLESARIIGGEHETVEVGGQSVRVYAQAVSSGGRPLGYVVVGRPLQMSSNTFAWLRNLMVLFGAFMLLLAGGVGYLLARAILSPIDRVTQTARAIGLSQRLDRRLPPYRHGDEVGRLITTFNGMLARIEIAFQAQRRFVSDASHELRTPITTILGNVQALRRGGLAPSEREEAIADIESETERMSRLVQGMLALARADSGRTLARDLVPVNLLVQEVVRQAQRISGDVTVRLGSIEECEALGDADHLRQLLLILVDNAVKYNRPQGEVVIDVQRDGARLRLSVSDTGYGIAEEDLPHVFDRFYRSKSRRGEDGTGLGLSIARWIAESHGGELTVASTLDKGSAFTFTMNSAQGDATPVLSHRAPTSRSGLG